MPSQSLLQILGSRGDKDAQYAPIFTDRFFIGIWTNRNPLRSPLSTFYADGWHLGGTDVLIGGENIELSPRLTLCRRPGVTAYSTATIPLPPSTFYSFKQFGGAIEVIVDTPTSVYVLTPTSLTTIFTKSPGAASQANYLGIGNTLYFGDGVDQMAWQNGVIRNWGISIGLFANAVGPNTAAAGANAGGSFIAWVNPGNITSPSSYSTATLGGSTATNHSQDLNATQFSFSIPYPTVITGIQVTVEGFYTPTATGSATLSAVLLESGSVIGTGKSIGLGNSNATFTFGGSADLWGTSVNYNDVSQTTFGVAFFVIGNTGISAGGTASIRNATITIFGTGGPTVTKVGSGSFVSYSGYQYVVAYGNSSSSQVSSTTPPSANTGPFGGGISTSTVAAAGTGYATSDTGVILAGNFLATYTVNTVGGSGEVLTYTISAAGLSYSVANNIPTSVGGAQPGVGTGFTVNITALSGINHLGIAVVASTDPQVNQIWVFRTADGGSTFLNLPNSPYPNASATLADNSPDSQLNILQQAPLNDANDPPPAGALDPVLYLGIVWVHVGNAVYFARSGSAIVGTQYESFPPANVFTFPETVIRKVPINAGLLIFTTSDIYIIVGQNTATSILTPQPFLAGFGIVSWDCVWIDGSIIYFYTSDRRLIRLDPSAGVEDMGFPISDQLAASFNPLFSYVTYLSNTSNDSALYICDGNSGWYRCNPNQAPDGQITGPVWSPKANIVGGIDSLVAVETSPGIHQLMMGSITTNGPVLVRDSTYTTFTDNGSAYEANYQMGSIVLAQPGQVAAMRFVTCELIRTGTSPVVGVLLGEMSGSFENISGYVVPDPPYLPPSNTLFNNRYYFKQTVGGSPPKPTLCRHLQVSVDYGTDTVQNELLSMTINGAILLEK